MSTLVRLRKATLAPLMLTGAAVALAIVFGGGKETEAARVAEPNGVPTVSIVSPRNGQVQPAHAVVVKVELDNFELAPASFGQEPELGEGHLRFSLNRVLRFASAAVARSAQTSLVSPPWQNRLAVLRGQQAP
jgi:hypothetical protein